MKITLKTVVIFAMCALLLLLGACGKKDAAKTDAVTNDQAQNTAPVLDGSDEDKYEVETPNPFVDCDTAADAEKIAGFPMDAPETIDGYDAPVIQAVENDTFQYIYSNADGGEILIRKVVDGDADVSGDCNEYENEQTTDDGVTLRGDGDSVTVAIWSKDGYSYCVRIEGGASAQTVTDLVSQVK